MSTAVDRRIRVLVVDDTPDIRMLLRLALDTEQDIEVVDEAGDGRQAVELATRLQPDIVLLDLAMPVLDGLQALPLLRAACPDARVVVLSGFESGSMASSALSAGAADYLQKGVSPDAIIDCVRRLGRPGTPPAPPTAWPVPLPSAATVWGWLDRAPFAVVVLALDGTRVQHANAAAEQLLDWPPAALPPADAVTRLREAQEAGRLLVDELPGTDHVVLHLRRPTEPDEAALVRAAVASTAHEIRNPVSTLMGIARTLTSRGSLLAPEVQAELLAAVGRQARVLDRVAADLLAASQAERGSLLVEPSDMSLLPALQAAAVVADEERLVVHCPAGLRVHADPVRVDQMLVNLVSNARKYGSAPFSLSASRRAGGFVAIEVDDSGPGVPEEFRPRLFAQFARAGGTRLPGSGIGLYLVRSLAEAQGGAAWYAPRPGGGSSFGFSLPAAD